MAEGEPNLNKHLLDSLREIGIVILGPILAWIAYTYTRFIRDQTTVKRLRIEQTEYRNRFGLGLIEHTQDTKDRLDAHEAELARCRRIHNGIGDGESSLSIVQALRNEIKQVDVKIDSHRLEELEYKKSIDNNLLWLRDRLERI